MFLVASFIFLFLVNIGFSKPAGPKRPCCDTWGVIEKYETDCYEECDPFATPTGCPEKKYCAVFNCKCYIPICDPKNNEYPTKEDCEEYCERGSLPTEEWPKCSYNYKTGCWDCVWYKVVVEKLADPKTKPEMQELIKKEKWWIKEKEDLKKLFEEWKGLEGGILPGELDWPLSSEWQIKKQDQSKSINAENFIIFYNSNLITLPIISELFANERINLHLGKENYSVVTVDKQIEKIYGGLLEDESVNIYADQDVIDKIANGELTIIEALESGKIRYEAVGLFNSLKFGIATFFFNIYSFFSGLFD